MTMDEGLRLSAGLGPEASRPNPAEGVPDSGLDEDTRRHVAGLMRINHTGEICAQALYAGQAMTARSAEVKAEMETASQEEIDHLSWCEQRLQDLDSQPSLLNPLWYAGSFAIGAVAGLAGDGWSLGFLKETEIQVEAHLADHLDQLPEQDKRSQAILDQMKQDEAKHAEMAAESGAFELPAPIKGAMNFASQIMKAVAYRI
ncbi:MAG: 2-polyprenyl-3-methyl-6-methoxy-1,4-benzoquinone monooxygenase [Gammaproteobacteria bacterium]|nr:2-polyprenyl-3-methyl-6-methoxy-1,4-benzoquinone monooxygenase [Gammaproteobacteria bacterium]NNE04285.1 2-polyprenyl-3-methyl-6-methoxy-1,4-benzoquinone monooxygenase [Xanthomonadales bacterium]